MQPAGVVLGRAGEDDRREPLRLDERLDRRARIRTGVDALHVALARLLDEPRGVLERPVVHIGALLGRNQEGEPLPGARTATDLGQQDRRRCGAVGDDEGPARRVFGHSRPIIAPAAGVSSSQAGDASASATPPNGSGLMTSAATAASTPSSTPSSTTATAPCATSSAGWKSSRTGLARAARRAASSAAAPSSAAVCASWPQACMAPGTLEPY